MPSPRLVSVIASIAACVGAHAETIPSCVGSDAIEVAARDAHAWLEPGDIDAVTLAMHERYPQLARDGFAAERLLLWRKPTGTWLYVALVDTGPRSGCFTATVSASTLPITRTLLRKYFAEL